eukprot:TRINITY_DN8261_c0_g1_i1.p1 TRINITY_DN8261_c0_g1~~TRINITY_DN8261_c0_g1_i1.p1  ORF type:complete len:374 (-),score=101.74 TRINITY_DN8261_c0_g1_i1:142-1263(-)
MRLTICFWRPFNKMQHRTQNYQGPKKGQLERTPASELWLRDLDALNEAYDLFLEAVQQDAASNAKLSRTKKGAIGKKAPKKVIQNSSSEIDDDEFEPKIKITKAKKGPKAVAEKQPELTKKSAPKQTTKKKKVESDKDEEEDEIPSNPKRTKKKLDHDESDFEMDLDVAPVKSARPRRVQKKNQSNEGSDVEPINSGKLKQSDLKADKKRQENQKNQEDQSASEDDIFEVKPKNDLMGRIFGTSKQKKMLNRTPDVSPIKKKGDDFYFDVEVDLPLDAVKTKTSRTKAEVKPKASTAKTQTRITEYSKPVPKATNGKRAMKPTKETFNSPKKVATKITNSFTPTKNESPAVKRRKRIAYRENYDDEEDSGSEY